MKPVRGARSVKAEGQNMTKTLSLQHFFSHTQQDYWVCVKNGWLVSNIRLEISAGDLCISMNYKNVKRDLKQDQYTRFIKTSLRIT